MKESTVFKAGLMALGATQGRWWRGDSGYMPRLRKIYIKAVLKMPELVFSFILPRFFPDLMSMSDSYWLELSVSRSHHIIFTTSKSHIFRTERVSVACCFGMLLFGKVSTFSRFCSWRSFLVLTFSLGARAGLLFTGRSSNQVHLLTSPSYYLFTL